ncbi:MAG: hypothetical protein ABGU97_07375 [Xylella fastidiosa subsp. multiplex]
MRCWRDSEKRFDDQCHQASDDHTEHPFRMGQRVVVVDSFKGVDEVLA